MSIIFTGSLLTYGFLSILGNYKGRYMVYIVSALLFVLYPKYAAFLAGIICGDFFVHYLNQINMEGMKRELISFFILLSGVAIGVIPSIFIAPPLTLEYTCNRDLIVFSWCYVKQKGSEDIILQNSCVTGKILVLFSFDSNSSVIWHKLLDFQGNLYFDAALHDILLDYLYYMCHIFTFYSNRLLLFV